MLSTMKRAAAVAFVTAGAITTVGAAEAQASPSKTGTYHGCPYGYVCIYGSNKVDSWDGDSPSNLYYSYTYYNLRNQYGPHRIFNNQSGSATVRTCTGYYGTGCQFTLAAQKSIVMDLTPINSITLQP